MRQKPQPFEPMKLVRTKSEIYVSPGHAPFPIGSEVHLPQSIADVHIKNGHAEEVTPPAAT